VFMIVKQGLEELMRQTLCRISVDMIELIQVSFLTPSGLI